MRLPGWLTGAGAAPAQADAIVSDPPPANNPLKPVVLLDEEGEQIDQEAAAALDAYIEAGGLEDQQRRARASRTSPAGRSNRSASRRAIVPHSGGRRREGLVSGQASHASTNRSAPFNRSRRATDVAVWRDS